MPELPEVETIKRELEKAILGKKILEVCVHSPKLIREISVEKFKKGLTGASIKKILRKAKVLVLELSNGKSLVIHLKMTGQLVYPGQGKALRNRMRRPTLLGKSLRNRMRRPTLLGKSLRNRMRRPTLLGKASRVRFRLSDANWLDFNDQRLFAELRLMDNWQDLKFIQGLGPEPFDISPEQFKQMLDSKKTKIKPLLMDQTFISGIGNLYAAEALFRARIDPLKSASSLSDKEKELLFKEIKDTLKEAIAHKGSSVDQYVQLSGRPGDYARYHKVYDREGKPCLVCKTPIKRISLAGRGTYFCPLCQK